MDEMIADDEHGIRLHRPMNATERRVHRKLQDWIRTLDPVPNCECHLDGEGTVWDYTADWLDGFFRCKCGTCGKVLVEQRVPKAELVGA